MYSDFSVMDAAIDIFLMGILKVTAFEIQLPLNPKLKLLKQVRIKELICLILEACPPGHVVSSECLRFTLTAPFVSVAKSVSLY